MDERPSLPKILRLLFSHGLPRPGQRPATRGRGSGAERHSCRRGSALHLGRPLAESPLRSRRTSRAPRRCARDQRRQPHPGRNGQDADGRMDRPPVARRKAKRSGSSAADTAPAAARTTKPGNWPGNCRACRTCRTRIAWPRPAGRSGSSDARCSCWTMPSSIAASPATWISCSWTPWNRWAMSTSFPAARSANRWKGWPEPMSSPCRGPIC